MTRVVNQLGDTYTYQYDAAGRLVGEIDWGERETRYARDVTGKLLAKARPMAVNGATPTTCTTELSKSTPVTSSSSTTTTQMVISCRPLR
ncbi:YD repeat-containing protein [Burkholderia pseudomultivorans]|nr:RHS repeat domain-containing protein [Burkholderia pseudomultivorans]MDS0793062.1 YD repeat-containing protein [Burkholderia pseudomultivorans]